MVKHIKINRSFVSIWAALLLIFLISCSFGPFSKADYLRDFNSFVKETKKNSEGYTKQDWKNADKQYEKFAGEYYEKFRKELTRDDQFFIGKTKAAYGALRIKFLSKEAWERAKEFYNQGKGAVEELIDSMKIYKRI